MESLVELIEELFGRGWAIVGAIVVILAPVAMLCLVGAGLIDAEFFSHFG
jgi:uncharacterized membrane protein YgaE (UPF0421/DUF939 family)